MNLSSRSLRFLGFGCALVALSLLPSCAETATTSNCSVTGVVDQYVIAEYGTPSIRFYNRTDTGSATAVRTISGAATTLAAFSTANIFPDMVNGKLYVADNSGNRVLRFDATASGNVAPELILTGAATLLNSPNGIFVDTVNSEIYVANAGGNLGVNVWPIGATGNTAPTRTIAGASTLVAGSLGVFVDTTNNELYVSNASSGNPILVFSRTANGNVAPSRWIGGAATLITATGNYGVNVDLASDLVWVSTTSTAALRAYARTGSGNLAPTKSITGAATNLAQPYGVELNATLGEIVTYSFTGNLIQTFLLSDSGNVAPQRTISGPTNTSRVSRYYCQ